MRKLWFRQSAHRKRNLRQRLVYDNRSIRMNSLNDVMLTELIQELHWLGLTHSLTHRLKELVADY